MSSPNYKDRRDSANSRQAFDAQSQHEPDIDPDLDSSLLGIDNNMESRSFMSGHPSHGMAQSPASGYTNSSTSRISNNVQGNTTLVPQTPTPPMKRQHTGSGKGSLTTPQKLQYDSSNSNPSNVGGPYTPRNYNNTSFTTANSPYHMAPGPLNMAAANTMQRIPDLNGLLSTQSPQLSQDFLNMNSTHQQHRSLGSFNQPTSMVNSQSPRGRQDFMSMADMSHQRRGSQVPFNQIRSYPSTDDDLAVGVFDSGFSLETFQDQGQDWNMLGNNNQQGFSGGQSMDNRDIQFGNNEQNLQYPSPTTLANQPGGYTFDQQNTADSEDEELDEYQNDGDGDGDSDYEAGKGTPSTSNTLHSSSRLGPIDQISKYQGIIKSEGGYKALLAKRAKAAKDSVSRGRLDTGPTDNGEILEYIQELFDAFMNTVGIVDKKAQDGRKAQAARRLDDDYYSAEVVEIACWELFIKCRQSCMGIRLVDAYHKTKREGNDVHKTFKERWDAIINACQHSKAVCKQVLDPLYVDRLVDAPEAQLQMKLNNKKINAERDKQNRLGRMAIKNGVSLTDIPGMVKEEETEDGIVTPSKRPARQRGSAAKRRNLKQVKYEYPDEEEEDGDPTYETPVKKERADPITVSSRPVCTPRKKTPRKATTSSAKSKKVSEYPKPTPELEMEYCVAICDLLKINRQFAQEFTLEQLQVFARPYNGEQRDVPWYHESFVKGQYGLGHQMFHGNGKLIPHFTWKLRELRILAIARGELEENGEHIPDHEVQYYTVSEDPELKKILGITFNAFGIKIFNEPHPREASSS
ncbi:hypothetical protein ONS95_011283 [Cadophora gregata]|uniref:uncharacterized protein n=1 Tax=Cadophora gregata TaxID=51156 RepID=UPI0026DDAF1C|nr:uncharacterized protein ONS95_011283 [Cadophora gregata]KAK0119853.1 hypothetical protein ONS95_011283 [Cadophora gregata]KAK0120887.1 hypothetical protein ONS96_011085 [Cadophora gregata f. sp. sojae]